MAKKKNNPGKVFLYAGIGILSIFLVRKLITTLNIGGPAPVTVPAGTTNTTVIPSTVTPILPAGTTVTTPAIFKANKAEKGRPIKAETYVPAYKTKNSHGQVATSKIGEYLGVVEEVGSDNWVKLINSGLEYYISGNNNVSYD